MSRSGPEIPPEWQQTVMNAIYDSYARQANSAELKTRNQILTEVKENIRAQMASAGADPERVPAYMYLYLGKNLTRLVNYCLWYAEKNPPMVRKGYGKENYEEVQAPGPLIFLFAGGVGGGWKDGEWEDFPVPDDMPDDWDDDGYWAIREAPNEIATVRRVMSEHPEIDTRIDGERGRILDYVAHELGSPPWGRKARREDGGNKNDDGLTYLRSDGLFEIYDVISGSSGDATWHGYGPFAPGQNGWWAPPDPID